MLVILLYPKNGAESIRTIGKVKGIRHAISDILRREDHSVLVHVLYIHFKVSVMFLFNAVTSLVHEVVFRSQQPCSFRVYHNLEVILKITSLRGIVTDLILNAFPVGHPSILGRVKRIE